MIQYTCESSINHRLFTHPFDRDLDPTNRWMVLRVLLPWDRMASVLIKRMSSGQGRPSVDIRYVLGVLVIQSLENLTDEGVLQTIQENIYMQHFIGLPSFTTKEVFVPELLVTIRERLGLEGSKALSELIEKAKFGTQNKKNSTKKSVANDDDDFGYSDESIENLPTQSKPTHHGTLKIDATVAPSSVRFPTDVSLLNDAVKCSESLIDFYWSTKLFPQKVKPRTYRKQIKKQVLSVLKTKKPSHKKIRTAKKILLHALHRNIGYLNKLFDHTPKCLTMLDRICYRNWLVIQHIYQQQKHLFDEQTTQVADRIVSLHQPWVRPIVRGKAGKMVEFGAQINMSECDGYVSFDQVDFNKFNEAKYLKQVVENYLQKHGYYPQAVLVDRIYLNRENRKWLDQLGIKHYGPPLGRPKQMSTKQKRERQQKQNKRSEIEGKFGQAKMVFGMNRIATRAYQSSLAKIGLIAMAMNIWRLLKEVSFLSFFETLSVKCKIATEQTLKILIIMRSNQKSNPIKISQLQIAKF